MSNTKSNKQYPIGFTAVDNRIFYMQDNLSPSAFSIFIRIYRMSEGYDGKPKSLSNTYFQKSCNISKNTITKAVKELELSGIINTQRRSRSNTLYSINLDRINTLYLSNINDDSQYTTECGTITKPTDSQEVCSTKENLIKQNNTKENIINDINIPFDVFWDLYDYKKNKSLCITKWQSMTDEERTLTIESLEVYKQSTPDKTYRKYPLNYLENECWNDEHIVIAVGLVDNQNIAHNNKYNSNNANNAKNANNNVFSASHKEFKTVITAKDTNSTKHTKDDLECNLEALGISSVNTTNNITNDTTPNDTVDIVALSSQVHWSELKARGLLKKQVNPTASMISTEKQKEIDDFLNSNSSKRFSNFKDIA